MTEALTYDMLMNAIAEVEAVMAGVVVRFVGHPDTMDEFVVLPHNAGVQSQRSTDPLAGVVGIPLDRDERVRRGWIEGRDNRGDLIRLYAVVAGRAYEYTDHKAYFRLSPNALSERTTVRAGI